VSFGVAKQLFISSAILVIDFCSQELEYLKSEFVKLAGTIVEKDAELVALGKAGRCGQLLNQLKAIK